MASTRRFAMKFFALIGAFIALACFASPTLANNPWEGLFDRATQNQDGTWTASVKIRATGKTQTKHFQECRRKSGKWECRNQIEGGSSGTPVVEAEVEVHVTVEAQSGHCRNTSSTTCYAVFNPRYMATGQVKNTEGRPQVVSQCKQAGSSRCIFVEAPLHNWQRANNIALDRTGWPLQRF